MAVYQPSVMAMMVVFHSPSATFGYASPPTQEAAVAEHGASANMKVDILFFSPANVVVLPTTTLEPGRKLNTLDVSGGGAAGVA